MFFSATNTRGLSISNYISIDTAIFAQLTAGIESLYFTIGHRFRPQNCLFARGCGPHLKHGSFGPPKSTSQTTSQSAQLFCMAHDRDRPTDRQTTLLRL